MDDLIGMKELDKAMGKAIETVYLRELRIRTPKKTGFHAGQWDIRRNGAFNYSLVNPFGKIIIFLEGGTKAHFIQPKTKKMLKFPIKTAPVLRNKREQQKFREKGVIFFFNRQRKVVLGYVKEGGKYFCLAREVKHPGFEGKHFIKNMLEDASLTAQFESKLIQFSS